MEGKMTDLYNELKKRSGQNCFTLTLNHPAIMDIDDAGITVTYPSGREIYLPVEMVKEAIHRLQTNGELGVDEIHEQVTYGDRLRTDKLMAILREIPGVTITPRKRHLFFEINHI